MNPGSMTFLQRAMAGNKTMRSSSMTRGFSKGLGYAARMPFGTGAGSLATLGLGVSAFTYDSTKDSLVGHMGKSIAMQGVGLVRDAALFGTIGRFGIPGMAAAFALSIGSDILMEHGVNSILKQRNREKGIRPVTQNERTMRATQQAMGLLGQGGRASMLGQEAAYMHN